MAKASLDVHGRTITVEVSEDVDEFFQFRVRLFVDGTSRPRFDGHFTDRGYDDDEPCGKATSAPSRVERT